MSDRSYLDKDFTVSDPDARLRQPNDLMAFQSSGGSILRISQFTVVRVDTVERVQVGASKVALFAHTKNAEGAPLGWTSTNNLQGKFVNETLELIKPQAGDGKFGPNAAWAHGAYAGQIDLIEIVDAKTEIKRIAASTVQPYLDMVGAALAQNVPSHSTAGFAPTRSRNSCGTDSRSGWQGSTRPHRLEPRTIKTARPSTSRFLEPTATRSMTG